MRFPESTHDAATQTWTLPRLPESDTAALRALAVDLGELSALLDAAFGEARDGVEELRRSWLGLGAAAGGRPLGVLDEQTRALHRALDAMAAELDRLARELDAAHARHAHAWRRILAITVVVTVTAAAVTVTVASAGTASPVAAAAEAATIGAAAGELTAAGATAGEAALGAAEALLAAGRLARSMTVLRTIVVPRLYLTGCQLPMWAESPLGGAVIGGASTAVVEYADGEVSAEDIALSALLGAAENAATTPSAMVVMRPYEWQLRRMDRADVRTTLLLRGKASAWQYERPYSASPKQLQSHYKHAEAFGLPGNYSKANERRFDATLDRFRALPDTVRVDGTYHRRPAIIYADYDRGLMLICHPDGSFWWAAQASPVQRWYLWFRHAL